MKNVKKKKKKGGRPELSNDLALSKVVNFRLTPKKFQELKELSKGFGSVSDFVKHKIFSDNYFKLSPKEYFASMDKVNYQLYKIGNNINQVAKLANQKGMSKEVLEAFNLLLAEVKEQEQKIININQKFLGKT